MKSVLVITLLFVAISVDANAGTLFSDLGVGGSYNTGSWYPVFGSMATIDPNSQTDASLFTVAGIASEAVSEIDLGAGLAGCECGATSTFYAGIFTDNSGVPGSQIANAYWNFSNTTTPGGLVSITGISGVTLTGGDQYFMVLGPLNTNDDGYLGWYINSQNVTGNVQSSPDGGATWTGGIGTTGAFDVLGTLNSGGAPEPSTFALLGGGIALLGLRRRCKETK